MKFYLDMGKNVQFPIAMKAFTVILINVNNS